MIKFYLIPHGVLALGEGSKWHGWLFEKVKDTGKFLPLRQLDADFIARAQRAANNGALAELQLEMPEVGGSDDKRH